jgi:hypothetical protein
MLSVLSCCQVGVGDGSLYFSFLYFSSSFVVPSFSANLFASFSRDVVASHSQMQMKGGAPRQVNALKMAWLERWAKALKDWTTRTLHSDAPYATTAALSRARQTERDQALSVCLCLFRGGPNQIHNNTPLAFRGYPPKKENKK